MRLDFARLTIVVDGFDYISMEIIMTYKRIFMWVGLLLTLPFLTLFSQVRAHEAHTNAWEAVSSTVPVGKGVKISIRLKSLQPPPAVEDITVKSIELDMAPDGMEMMKAPLKALPSSEPGVLVYETDPSMAGRWELEIIADVKGEPEPYSGSVIFTAVEEKAEKEKSAPAASEGKERKILYYRNPMGLPDTSPAPKKDSMGMDYIPVYEDEAAGPQGSIRLSPGKIQRTGIRTEPVERRVLVQAMRGTGTVAGDETRMGEVTARFSGYVEKLFVSETGKTVQRGQPLMRVRIEDPELIQRQAALTTTLVGATRSLIVTDTAKRDLRYIYGFPESAIDEIKRTRKPIRTLTLNAPNSGAIIEKNVVEGAKFNPGDVLMRTTDLSKIWVIAQIPERDFGRIKVGQTARMNFRAYPDKTVHGKIMHVHPEMDMATRTGMVRIELPNGDGYLKTGMYADVLIEAGSAVKSVLSIPDSAVIDSGTRQVAFVAKEGGMFEPRDVKLGQRGNGYVEIKEGLKEGEKIVVSGNFLIDAESNLQSALAAFTAKTEPESPQIQMEQ